MLRKLRITIGAVCFLLMTLIFLDFTGFLHHWLGWLAKVQFFPALMAANVIIVGVLVFLTLLFGRGYCSTLCPLGVFQDAISWVASKKTKKHFSYRSANNLLRYIILTVFVFSVVAGIGSLTALLEPYSAYGRIASNLFGPIYLWCNNALAYFAERMDSYAFYSVDVWMKGLSTFIISFLTFSVLLVLAWKHGRLYCNTICPVGAFLGLLSKFSLLKPRIDKEKCTHCGLCARNCKASCIDAKSGTIDYSRCVSCFNCIGICPQGGVQYTLPTLSRIASPMKKEIVNETEPSRRKFLVLSSLLAMAVAKKGYAEEFDGGLALIQDKKSNQRSTPIVPPGSLNIQNFRKHCTGCQLCVSVCPNGVLRPSGDIISLMQPEMSYEKGYCRPECTKCSEVCPSGAIYKINVAEKSAIQIGHAVWSKDLCIVNKDKVSCDNCARHCPTGAIQMVAQSSDNPSSLKIPIVDESRCIGCGACENLCPSRPYSAIYVEGHQRHKTI